MTVTATARRIQLTGNGSNDTFTYSFEIFDQAEIEVYVDTTLQTITTDYTVTGVDADSGGTVVFEAGSIPANNTTVTIQANQSLKRTTAFQTSGSFKASTVNDELDRMTAMINELDGRVGRTIQLDVTDDTATLTLPAEADRLGKFLSFDSVTGDVEATQAVGTWQGNWATATAYAKGDIVKDSSNNNVYYVQGDYTSGASVAADVSSSDIVLVVDAAAAATSASNAATSASNASTSASNASTSASTATTQASNASTSASSASTQASNAATSASTASTQASNASTSATNAATAETNAETAETNAETAETNAETAETNAATSATNAASSATDSLANAAGFRFTFDSSTSMGDPGTGDVRFNHATLSSVTALAFDATSADTGNPDVSDFIVTWDDSTTLTKRGTITMRKIGTPGTFVTFDVDAAITDNTGWLQVPVAFVDSNGTISNTNNLIVHFTRTGNKGDTGSGSGDLLAANNLSDVGNAGTSLTNLGVGSSDSPTFTGLTLSADLVTTSTVDSRDIATDGTKLDGIATGAKVGDVVGPSSSTDNSIARYDSTTGLLLLDSGVSIDDTDNLFGHGSAFAVKVDSYTLTAAENGKVVTLNKGTAVTLTLPEDGTETLATGFQCVLIQLGAGQVTVAKEGTDTIVSKGSNLKLTGQGSIATVLLLASGTPNSWFLGGDLAA